MATLLCQTVVGFASCSSVASGFRGPALPNSRVRAAASQKRVGVVGVRAEIETQVVLNPSIAKDSEKVVDTVMLAEVSKPVTAYCRCWRSGTFPLCDGTHVKHNKATGDNVGPLVLKK